MSVFCDSEHLSAASRPPIAAVGSTSAAESSLKMLGLDRRPTRGSTSRITTRMIVCCGWAASTMTILAVFMTALDGLKDQSALPRDAVAVRAEPPAASEGVETSRRRSLSAKDTESNATGFLEIMVKDVGRATNRRHLSEHRRLEQLLQFKRGRILENGGSLLVDGRIVPSEMDSARKGDGAESTSDISSGNNFRRSRGKEIRERRGQKTRERLPAAAFKQAPARKVVMEIMQTQLTRPEVASSSSIDLSPAERETSRGSLRLEEMPAGRGMSGLTMMNGRLPVTQLQMPDVDADVAERRVSACSADGVPLVEDGIFWSWHVEQLIPEGITDDNVLELRDALDRLTVRSMEDAEWNRCGRPKNQFVVLEDGTQLCARYRFPQETLIRGEILSFYLSRLLAFDNVPAVILSQLNVSDPLWLTQNLTAAQWNSGSFVALIQWMNDLNHEKSRVRIPRVLLSAYESGASMTSGSLDHDQLTSDQLTSLVQWTDLILFDYITGHYDRVASMQDGAEREMRPSIMSESIRNLRQIRGNGKLILIDNESGLVDGYELMYRRGSRTGSQFLGFHRRLLRSSCVFRRRTVARIRWLASRQHPDRVLEEFVGVREPLYRKLKETPEVGLFRTFFGVRLKEIVDWIDHCASARPR